MSKQAASPAIDWSQWKKAAYAPSKDSDLPRVTVSVGSRGVINLVLNKAAVEALEFDKAEACDLYEGQGEHTGRSVIKADKSGACRILRLRSTMRITICPPQRLAEFPMQVLDNVCRLDRGIFMLSLPAFEPRPADWRPPAHKPKAASPAKDETAADGSALTAFDRKVKDLLAQRMNAPTIAKTLKQSTETVLASLRKQGLVA